VRMRRFMQNVSRTCTSRLPLGYMYMYMYMYMYGKSYLLTLLRSAFSLVSSSPGRDPNGLPSGPEASSM